MEILLDALHKLNIARQDGCGTWDVTKKLTLWESNISCPLARARMHLYLSRLVAFWGETYQDPL